MCCKNTREIYSISNSNDSSKLVLERENRKLLKIIEKLKSDLRLVKGGKLPSPPDSPNKLQSASTINNFLSGEPPSKKQKLDNLNLILCEFLLFL